MGRGARGEERGRWRRRGFEVEVEIRWEVIIIYLYVQYNIIVSRGGGKYLNVILSSYIYTNHTYDTSMYV